jgi:hypothetical protein
MKMLLMKHSPIPIYQRGGFSGSFFSNNIFFVDTITLLAKEKAKWFEQIFANLCGSRCHKQTVQMFH